MAVCCLLQVGAKRHSQGTELQAGVSFLRVPLEVETSCKPLSKHLASRSQLFAAFSIKDISNLFIHPSSCPSAARTKKLHQARTACICSSRHTVPEIPIKRRELPTANWQIEQVEAQVIRHMGETAVTHCTSQNGAHERHHAGLAMRCNMFQCLAQVPFSRP